MSFKIAPADDPAKLRVYEEANRYEALSMLNVTICETNGALKGTDFRAEATYYLSTNDFDYRKAADAYVADYKFEQE